MSSYTTPPVSQWLRDALNSATTLQRNTADLSLEKMIADDWILGAVERRLEVIGEALRRVRAAAPEIEIPFPEIHGWIALRHISSHVYREIDLDAIWMTCTEEVPLLIQTLESLLGQNEDPGDPSFLSPYPPPAFSRTRPYIAASTNLSPLR